jgi:hypothetical protein
VERRILGTATALAQSDVAPIDPLMPEEGAAMAETEPEYIEPDDGQDPEGHETVDEDRGTDADADTDGGDDGS